MPTLDWIGKKAVVNHHKEVPFHLLKCDPDLSVGEPESGNLLVQGDNLLALKALMPYYAAGETEGAHRATGVSPSEMFTGKHLSGFYSYKSFSCNAFVCL
jgi:hypothetical protein